MNDLNYLQRLKTLNLETLESRRLKTDLITMFKILNNLIDIDFHNFFSLSTVANTRGHRLNLLSQFVIVTFVCSLSLVDVLTAGTLCLII